jgi:hypothetical protein
MTVQLQNEYGQSIPALRYALSNTGFPFSLNQTLHLARRSRIGRPDLEQGAGMREVLLDLLNINS